MESGDIGKIVKNAINQGLHSLYESHNFDVGFDKFRSYLEISKVVERVGDVASGEEIQSVSNKPEFLKNKIIEYIKSYEPFNEEGKKLLGDSLESLTNEVLDKNVPVVAKDYRSLEKVAAAVLGVCGILLVVSSGLRLTGNVIGNNSTISAGFLGVLFVFVGLGIFLRSRD